MPRPALSCLIVAILLFPATALAVSFDQAVKDADPSAKYLVYLPGEIVEEQGRDAVSPRYGAYKYDAIVESFQDRGLVVVEDLRGRVNPNRYAAWLVTQLRRLKAAGVPSSNITVAGFSKGGYIALLVASSQNDPAMQYVIMAGCGRGLTPGPYQHFLKTRRGSRLKGRILSLYAGSDLEAGSCRPAVQQVTGPGVAFGETRLMSNRGHGLFYVPLPQWLNPVTRFALEGK
jgi:hypothetical protein